MSDFFDSIQSGLELAKKSYDSIQSIHGVIDEVDSAVISWSDENVHFEIREDALSNLKSKRSVYNYKSMVLLSDSEARHIGVLGISLDGFPCEVNVDNVSYVCSDISELRKFFNEYLSGSSFGRSLFSMINK